MARRRFLDAVRDVVERVLIALERAPYQSYQELRLLTSDFPSYFLTHESVATVEPHINESQLLAYRGL